MLKIVVPATEYYDEKNSQFVTIEETELHLEHSLVSLSKWESSWEVPFLADTKKTEAQTLDYIRCMSLDDNIPNEVYAFIPNNKMLEISKYINSKMTATWFSDNKKKSPNLEVITSELIYYWMITLNIPFECQSWHLSRLLTLINICNKKNAPAKKMSRSEIASRNKALNEQRRRQFGTQG